MNLEPIKRYCSEYENKQRRSKAIVKTLMTLDDKREKCILEYWLAEVRAWLLEREENYNKLKGFIRDQGSDSRSN